MRIISFYFILLFSITLFGQDYIQNVSGNVVLKGDFSEKTNAKSGKLYLYEILGHSEYLLDSAIVQSGQFGFRSRTFITGVYRLAFNNATNHVDIVVNPSESNELDIKFHNYRIKKGYNIVNSVENKIKKLYTKKEGSIKSKIKSIQKSQKTRDLKLQEMRNLQFELFQYGVDLHNENPGTYYGMIISHMQSPYNEVQHLYFNDIDFTDECIVRSGLLPHRIQTYIQSFNDYKNNPYGFHDAVDVVMEYAKKNEKVAEFCMYNMLDGFYNTGQTQTKNDAIWMNLCNYIMDEYIFGEGCGDDINPSELLKERASQYKNLQIGHIPPDIYARDMGGKAINLRKTCLNNKYTVLMFWASHCNHCMNELPGFSTWYAQNKNLDFEIIAVSLDSQKSKWESTVNTNNFNWINICEFKVYKSPICLDYKIKKTPTFFVLNKQMEIVAKPKSTHQLRSFLLSNK